VTPGSSLFSSGVANLQPVGSSIFENYFLSSLDGQLPRPINDSPARRAVRARVYCPHQFYAWEP